MEFGQLLKERIDSLLHRVLLYTYIEEPWSLVHGGVANRDLVHGTER